MATINKLRVFAVAFLLGHTSLFADESTESHHMQTVECCIESVSWEFGGRNVVFRVVWENPTEQTYLFHEDDMRYRFFFFDSGSKESRTYVRALTSHVPDFDVVDIIKLRPKMRISREVTLPYRLTTNEDGKQCVAISDGPLETQLELGAKYAVQQLVTTRCRSENTTLRFGPVIGMGESQSVSGLEFSQRYGDWIPRTEGRSYIFTLPKSGWVGKSEQTKSRLKYSLGNLKTH